MFDEVAKNTEREFTSNSLDQYADSIDRTVDASVNQRAFRRWNSACWLSPNDS
jgi:hypothetical protein